MNFETIFQDSYIRVIGEGVGISEDGRKFFSKFYEIFFASSDLVKMKFVDTDMDEQIKVLQKGLYQLIGFYLLKSDSDYLQAIARSHSQVGYDISPVFYELWLKALLQTVEQLDPEFQPLVGLAWKIVMTPGILYLQYHYDHPLL